MKKVFVVVVVCLALLPLAVNAQTVVEKNIGSWSIGGSSTHITVVNETDDGSILVTNIAGKGAVQSEKGNRFRVGIGQFSNWQGDVPVFINACTDTQEAFQYNAPPDWTTNEGNFPGVALTREFLSSPPRMRDIDRRIDGIERIIHGYPGEGAKKSELKEWRNSVNKAGISIPVLGCKDEVAISLVGFNWTWDGWNREIIVTIQGDRANGYHVVNPARRIN